VVNPVDGLKGKVEGFFGFCAVVITMDAFPWPVRSIKNE